MRLDLKIQNSAYGFIEACREGRVRRLPSALCSPENSVTINCLLLMCSDQLVRGLSGEGGCLTFNKKSAKNRGKFIIGIICGGDRQNTERTSKILSTKKNIEVYIIDIRVLFIVITELVVWMSLFLEPELSMILPALTTVELL